MAEIPLVFHMAARAFTFRKHSGSAKTKNFFAFLFWHDLVFCCPFFPPAQATKQNEKRNNAVFGDFRHIQRIGLFASKGERYSGARWVDFEHDGVQRWFPASPTHGRRTGARIPEGIWTIACPGNFRLTFFKKVRFERNIAFQRNVAFTKIVSNVQKLRLNWTSIWRKGCQVT